MRTQGASKTSVACQVCCLGLDVSCSQMPHTLYTSYWFTRTSTGFSQENVESWSVSQCEECSAPRLGAGTACWTPGFAGPSPTTVALSASPRPWPSVCKLPPPGATPSHSLARVVSSVPLHLEMAFIASMSLLTSPLATDQWNTNFTARCPLWWGSPVITNLSVPRLKGAL